MIGAIALMALLLIAGSGGGGGGGGGASTASNNNVGWKDINSSSEKDTLINKYQTAEYNILIIIIIHKIFIFYFIHFFSCSFNFFIF